MAKIQTLSSLKRITDNLKKKNKTIVFTNGCFDVIHCGHIKVLKEAKNKGDILVVGLNSDSSVKKIKGKMRPINSEMDRACILEAIQYVDYITIFKEETPYNTLKILKPDVLVKGGDWSIENIIGREFVKKVFCVKPEPGKSTTNTIKKIKSAE